MAAWTTSLKHSKKQEDERSSADSIHGGPGERGTREHDWQISHIFGGIVLNHSLDKWNMNHSLKKGHLPGIKKSWWNSKRTRRTRRTRRPGGRWRSRPTWKGDGGDRSWVEWLERGQKWTNLSKTTLSSSIGLEAQMRETHALSVSTQGQRERTGSSFYRPCSERRWREWWKRGNEMGN